MVRTYKRKTDRGCWSRESMLRAIESIINGEMGFEKASKTYNVPRATLHRRVKEAKKQPMEKGVLTVSTAGKVYPNKETINSDLFKPLGPIGSVFSMEEEDLLVDYVLKMEERLFGVTSYDLRRLAYQWAEKLGKIHSFNKDKQMAGKDWILGFKSRHPQIVLRTPEATSAARAAAFNKVNVGKYFDLLTRVIDENKLTPARIYNCDETGISVVPKHRSKILALKGRKQVGCLRSAERGNTVTIEVCFSAAGEYMPLLFVFPRVRGNDQLMNDCSPGAWAEYHASGWMQSEIFLSWFKKFVTWSRASKDTPVLLLLDGHATHTKNMAVIDYARDNGVIVLCFPPHCTHRLQPLDVSFMRPVSVFYDQEVAIWLRTNPGRVVTQFQIAKLYGNAFIKAATMATAVNGFRKTGIWPLNPTVFGEHDFAPSETTNRELQSSVVEPPEPIRPTNQDTGPSNDDNEGAQNLNSGDQCQTIVSEQYPIPDGSQGSLICTPSKSHNTPRNALSKIVVSPEDIAPIPTCNVTTPRNPRKRGKTAVITESPYKNELQDHINIRAEKERTKKEKSKQKERKSKQNKGKIQRKQRNLNEEFTSIPSTSTSLKVDQGQDKNKRKKPGNLKKKQLKRKRFNSSSSSETSDVECLYCGYLYSQSTEGWIKCCQCQKWAHCSCAGEEDEDDEIVYLCEQCKQ